MESENQKPVVTQHKKGCWGVMWKIMQENLEDLLSYKLWRAVVAELLGTTFLVLFGCGTYTAWTKDENIVQISLAFGLIVATMMWCVGHISGGHLNPSVTVATMITRRISIVRGFFYITAQVIGGIAAAGILHGLTPIARHANLGATTLGTDVDEAQGFGVEMLITFIYVFTVFASWDTRRSDLHGSSPLTVGLAVVVCHLFAVPYTKASMNSARSFGPAVVTGLWEDHWVYWVGPLAGGLVAGLLYDYIFAQEATVKRASKCLLRSRKPRAEKEKLKDEDPNATDLVEIVEQSADEDCKEIEKVKLADENSKE